MLNIFVAVKTGCEMIIISSIVAFTIIILLLVFMLLFAQKKISAIRAGEDHDQWREDANRFCGQFIIVHIGQRKNISTIGLRWRGYVRHVQMCR